MRIAQTVVVDTVLYPMLDYLRMSRRQLIDIWEPFSDLPVDGCCAAYADEYPTRNLTRQQDTHPHLQPDLDHPHVHQDRQQLSL
jgi:hypothetical protein